MVTHPLFLWFSQLKMPETLPSQGIMDLFFSQYNASFFGFFFFPPRLRARY